MGLRMIGFGVEDDRFWGVTIAIEDDESVLRLRSRSARRRTVKSKGAIRSRTAKSNSSGLWVRSLSGCDLSGRSLDDESVCSLPLSSSSISLSLSSLSLSLSVFRKIVFEGKIKTEINLHPTHGQLKTISEKCIFHAQPNTRKYEKAFPEIVFTQNKHSLIDFLRHDPGHAQS